MNNLFRSAARRRVGMLLIGAIALPARPAAALIWGVKTHDPVTGPPATLFWLDEATGGWGQVAPVTVGATQVDADGLAQDGAEALYAWRCETEGSTLLLLDPVTASGTPIGAPLAGRDIRGAAFTLAGRLLVFDNTASELLEIDPQTGLPLGEPVALEGLAPGAAGQGGDLCQDLDGLLLFTQANRLYRLDGASGRLSLLYEDLVQLGDGYLPWNVGLTLSPLAPADGALFLLDVSMPDGLFRYASSSDFSRTLLVSDVVPGYNAGRGDLAAPPAARTEITAIRVADNLADLDAFCREGIWVRVQHSPTLNPPSWVEVPGTLVQVAENPEGIATFCSWEGLPAPGEQGFWRLMSSLEEPE